MGLLTKHISKETAIDIALAHREIETATKLIAEIDEAIAKGVMTELRDAFGRRRGGIELGLPTSNSSQRCFDVPWELARPILQAHIAQQETLISVLSEKAKIEMAGGQS